MNKKTTTAQADKDESVAPLKKDYAHYPPVPVEQVKPPAHKKDKQEDTAGSVNQPPVENDTTKEKEKAINGSRKIVNETDESYSDGSGGGFEATEQVND